MPNRDDHILQARHNENFYDATEKTQYSDWAMTAIFYAALHYIDAFLATRGMVDPGGHSVRDNEVRQRPELRSVAYLYFRIKNRSVNARYYCYNVPRDELERCHDNDLARIKAHLLPLVGIN